MILKEEIGNTKKKSIHYNKLHSEYKKLFDIN